MSVLLQSELKSNTSSYLICELASSFKVLSGLVVMVFLDQTNDAKPQLTTLRVNYLDEIVLSPPLDVTLIFKL